MRNHFESEIFRTYLPFPAEAGGQDIKKIFSGWETVELAYGREGFAVIANEFEKLHRRKPYILIPAFICRDVPDTLQQLGIPFGFYQITRTLQPLREHLEKTAALKAIDFILAIDYFGFPADLTLIKDVANAAGGEVIEDNAHGFLSTDQNAQWLGLRGDWGIFSLRKSFPIKTGALVVKRGEIAIRPRWKSFDTPGLKITIKNFVRYFALVLGAKVFTSILRTFRKKPTLPGKPDLKFKFSQPVDVWKELNRYDLAKNSANRRKLFSSLLKQADAYRVEPVFKSISENIVPYCFPFWPKGDIREIERKFNSVGLEIFRWPELSPESAAVLDAEFKNIWAVRFIW